MLDGLTRDQLIGMVTQLRLGGPDVREIKKTADARVAQLTGERDAASTRVRELEARLRNLEAAYVERGKHVAVLEQQLVTSRTESRAALAKPAVPTVPTVVAPPRITAVPCNHELTRRFLATDTNGTCPQCDRIIERAIQDNPYKVFMNIWDDRRWWEIIDDAEKKRVG